jgi:hypothetical protein
MPTIIEEDFGDTIDDENMIIEQNIEDEDDNDEMPNLDGDNDNDSDEEDRDIIPVIAPPPVNPRIRGFNREMRNLQAFFNPNTGGLTTEAADISLKDESKNTVFFKRR